MADPAAPGAAAPPPTKQEAPLGVSSATGPTPNKGYEAAGRQKLSVVIRQLEQLVPLIGATSDIGKSVLKALNDLSKHIQPGEVTPAAERNSLESMAMQNQQNMGLMQQLKAAGVGGAPTPGQPPAGAPMPGAKAA